MKHIKRFNESFTSFATISSIAIIHDLYRWFKSKKLSKKISSLDGFLEILESIVDIDTINYKEVESLIKITIKGYSFGRKVYSDVVDSDKYKASNLDKIYRKIFKSNKLVIIIDKEKKTLKVKFDNNDSIIFDTIVLNEMDITEKDIKEIINLVSKYD